MKRSAAPLRTAQRAAWYSGEYVANGQNDALQGLNLPAPAALAGGISKALTSSYFSSVGAAFSTRTANDIVQETLPPSATTRGLESGPLFSVQFSQLPCSDVSSRFPQRAGTHRGPLGAGADPGSFGQTIRLAS